MTRLPALGPRGEGWVAGQFTLFAAILLAAFAGGTWSGSADVPAGLASIGVGVLLVGWAAAGLGSAVTPFPAPRADADLATGGVYALARHPMYGGVLLCAFGWSLAFASALGLALTAVLAVCLDLKSRREEAWLSARPGYAAYRARTRRRFVPYLY